MTALWFDCPPIIEPTMGSYVKAMAITLALLLLWLGAIIGFDITPRVDPPRTIVTPPIYRCLTEGQEDFTLSTRCPDGTVGIVVSRRDYQ